MLAHRRWTCMESSWSLKVMTVFTSNPIIIAVGLHMDVTNAYVFPLFSRDPSSYVQWLQGLVSPR